MSTDVEKLEDLHEQLRSARALLPQMVRKLAFASEDQGSTQLFQGVARDMLAWKTSSENLEAKYQELKPLIDELNGIAPVKEEPANTGEPGGEFLDLSK